MTEYVADVINQRWVPVFGGAYIPFGDPVTPPPPSGSGGNPDSPTNAVSNYIMSTKGLLQRAKLVPPSTPNYTLNGHAADLTIDARTKTFAATPTSEGQSYVVKIGNSSAALRTAWIGGLIRTNVPTTLYWDEVKNTRDGAGILFFANQWCIVDGVRFYNVQDAIRPKLGGSSKRWAIRNVWAKYIRDDFNEDDGAGAPGGMMHDCLVESCFMFLSCGQGQTWDGFEDMTISNCLIRLKPMPYRYDANPDPGDEPQLNAEYGNNSPRHAHLFKQYGASDWPIHMSDTVLYVEQHTVDALSNMQFPGNGSTYDNVTLLWKGYAPSNYPYSLPSGVTAMTLNTHTAAQIDAFWESKASVWKTRHGFESDADILDAPIAGRENWMYWPDALPA